MNLIETLLEFLVLFLLLILGIVFYIRVVKPRLQKRKKIKPFRILEKLGLKDKFKFTTQKIKAEIRHQTKVEVIPVIHIDERGGINFCRGLVQKKVNKKETVDYTADVKHHKNLNIAKKVPIRYIDGFVEEGALYDHYGTENLKINPKIDENAKYFYDVYINAYKELEEGYVDKSILAMSRTQQKILIMAFFGGGGIVSIFWVGAIVIFFFV